MVFNRRRSGGRHAKVDDAKRSRPAKAVDDFDDVDLEVDEPDEDDGADYSDTIGPYDSADAPKASGTVLDLGALRIPVVPDVEFRFNANPEGALSQVLLVDEASESALQLQVCAAPRTESLWDELRDEIRGTLTADGVSVREVKGVYGPELRAQVKRADGVGDLRLLGVDGPRWMVHAVYQGPAAIDPQKLAPRLVEVLQNLVVHRGPEAMPVREQLPLRLPKEVQQLHAEQMANAGGNAAATNGAPRVNGAAANGARPGGRRPSPRPRSNS